MQSLIFGVSLDTYVSKIEEYYSNKDYFRLYKQLEFEEKFAATYGSQSLIYLDMGYVDRLYKRVHLLNDSIFDVHPIDKLMCEGFSVDPVRLVSDRDYVRSLDPFNHPEYKLMLTTWEYWSKCSVKTKVKNDYLEKHPEYKVFHY